MAQSQPLLVPVLVEVLLFVARGFRAGRQLESTLEEAGAQLSQQAMAPKPPPQPTPEQMIDLQTTKVKADAETTKARLGVAEAEADHRTTMEKNRAEMMRAAMSSSMMTQGYAQ